MVSNPVWYCSRCGEYYPAGQPCPRCGEGDFSRPVSVSNYQIQSWNAHRSLWAILVEENHTDRAARMHGVLPEAVTSKQRELARAFDQAIGLGNVEWG